MPNDERELITPIKKTKVLETPRTGDGFRTSAQLHAEMFLRTAAIDSDTAITHLMQAMAQVTRAALLDAGLLTTKEEGE